MAGLRRLLAIVVVVSAAAACGRSSATNPPAAPTQTPATSTAAPPVRVVVFTHIEDNTPAGLLSAPATRTMYLNVRAALIAMAEAARRNDVPWTLQPDWKILTAALQYEDAETVRSTDGLNVFRYLRERLGVRIDPHSHEGGGYNYTDVAHLLGLLGVGGSVVIGGHIWDPALPQFQRWDRFRAPVPGMMYPAAVWRGEILMGSGTPNHVNDPIVSGVWRPRDPFNYFQDDPVGNVACVGAFKSDLPGIDELVGAYRSGQVRTTCMLTASYGVRPVDLLAPGGAATIENTVLFPLSALRRSGAIELTDFTALVETWKQRFGAQACLFDGRTTTP